MKMLELPSVAELGRLYHGFFDDFSEYVSGDLWTLVATDSGTATLQDAANGILQLAPSDGTVADNDEVYLKTTKEIFKIADDAPLLFESRVQYTEANTDDANVAMGFADAIAANSIVDNGAGVDTSFSGAMFYKVDGGTNWKVIYSDGATQNDVELTAANSLDGTAQTAGGASYATFRIEIRPVTSTKVDVLFWIDSVLVYKMKDQTIANATEANAFIGAKNGSANNEAINVDYIMCYQRRE